MVQRVSLVSAALAATVLAAITSNAATQAAQLQVAVGPRSCTVVSLLEFNAQGGQLRVGLGLATPEVAGSEAPTGACATSHFKLSGLEHSTAPRLASCSNPKYLGLQPANAGPASAVPPGSAFFVLESTCQQATTLTLDISLTGTSSSSSSSSALPHHQGSSSGAASVLWSRKLLQQAAPALSAAPATAPAPGPAGEVPTPVVSTPPFMAALVPVTNSSHPSGSIGSSNTSTPGLACCCSQSRHTLPYAPDQYTQQGCCCGNLRDCCSKGNDLLSRMCGDRSTCGVMLVVISAICIFGVAVCTAGGFCIRRRNRRVERERVVVPPTTGRRRSAEETECDRIMRLPAEKRQQVIVRPASGDTLGGSADCPICLDPVTISGDSWRVFPCQHGACSPCVADLVKHNERTVSEHKRVVHCPLCRQLALVPRSCLVVEAVPPTSSSASSASLSDEEVGTPAGSAGNPSDPEHRDAVSTWHRFFPRLW